MNTNINKKLIILEDKNILSHYENLNVCIWNGYNVKNNFISVPKYLELNAKVIRKKFIQLISNLSSNSISNKKITQHLIVNKNYNLWWMSLLSEKSHYKSPRIKDCLKMLALEEILLKENPSEVIFYFSDNKIAKTLKNLLINLNIKFNFKKVYKKKIKFLAINSFVKNIYHKLPYFFQSLIYFFKTIFSNRIFKSKNKMNSFAGENSIIFFSYLFHINKDDFNNGIYNTGQWGPIPKILKKLSIKSNWIHHFIPSISIPKPRNGIDFINKFNINSETNGNHHFLFCYLDNKIILKVLLNYLKIYCKYFSLIRYKNLFSIKNSNLNFWFLLKSDFNNSFFGPKLIENLLWIELFEKMFSEIPTQKIGIFLQENQSWEKALITAWRKFNHGKLLGLNNGFVRFWDTRFFDDYTNIQNSSSLNQPLPDFTILTDPSSWFEYVNSGYPESKLIKAETIRYFDLCLKNKKNIKKENIINDSEKIKGIVLGDIVKKTTNDMIKCIENTHNQKNYLWDFKAHPANNVNLKSYKNINITNLEGDLKNIISNYSIVIAPAATLSVLEAYISNIKIVIFLDNDEINLGPLFKLKDGVNTVSNYQEMNEAIDKKNLNKGFNRNDLFWFNEDMRLWSSILKSDYQ